MATAGNNMFALWPGDRLNFSIFIKPTFGFAGQPAASEAGHIANTNVSGNFLRTLDFMYYKFGLLFSMTILFSLSGCRGTVKLIDKFRTEGGAVRFYVENKENSKSDIKRLYASVNNRRIRIYYNFCRDEIVMTTEKTKQLAYTVFQGQLPINYDTNVYRKCSNLDLVILTRGDKILDSLGLDNFKKTHGTEAYQIEVNYYHGYPKGKRFGLENCR